MTDRLRSYAARPARRPGLRAPGARRRGGWGTVELALMTPLFAAVLVGMMDVGLAVEQHMRLQVAARAGAQVALRNPTDNSAITAAARAAAPDLPSMTVTPSGLWCECNNAPTTCTSACVAGLQRFVRVEARHPFSPITPLVPSTVSASVTLRIQ
ncbi:TadE family protein [Falsiroseomonas oryzae]|uniref:TadE family protein n=1 Tax=Falsiroseomonas oryzae TaxID=2766473 RepID=UPI0022EAA038|nr:TadE family protein [Roseomonas sp. MO-31]